MKKLASIILSVALLLSLCSVGFTALAEGTGPFSGGTGTAEDPYQIKTVDDLKKLNDLSNNTATAAEYLAKHYKLMANLELNANSKDYAKWGDAAPAYAWVAIGQLSNATLTGTFDGNGMTIKGLYSNAGNGKGFLWQMGEGAVIKNLTIANSYIMGGKYIFGIAGIMNGGTIDGCTVKDTILRATGGDYCAGIAGWLLGENLVIRNCVSSATILQERGNKTAGIAACSKNVTIENCANLGTVNGLKFVGGIVGEMDVNTVIKNCYNLGEITANERLGGLAGYFKAAGGTIENAFNAGKVTQKEGQTATSVGAVVGQVPEGNMVNSNTIKNVYIDKNVAGTQKAIGDDLDDQTKNINALETAKMQGLNAVANMKLDTKIWLVTKTYPAFGNGEFAFAGGDGSAEKPFEIATADQLKRFAELSNNVASGALFLSLNYKLTADIELNANSKDYAKWGDTAPAYAWVAIGQLSNATLTGTFDGNGMTIKGLYSNAGNGKGFLWQMGEGAVIKNLTIANSYIMGGKYIFGIAGIMNGGTIDGCTVKDTILRATGGDYCAGIAGWLLGENLVIRNCVSSATILQERGNKTAGIAACSKNVTIENCANLGTVNGLKFVGGIVGEMDANTVIKNCYNLGEITANERLGGLVGYFKVAGGTVENAFSAGKVTQKEGQTATSVGAAIGQLPEGNMVNSNTIKNVYINKDIAGTRKAIGDDLDDQTKNITALETAKMQGMDAVKTMKLDEKIFTAQEKDYPVFAYTLSKPADDGGNNGGSQTPGNNGGNQNMPESPRTGEVFPIALFAVLLCSVAAVVISRKRAHN